MNISSLLFEDYLQCPTKCWLRSRTEPTSGNVYAEWARAENETYFQDGLKHLLVTLPESNRATAPPIPKNLKDVPWCLAVNARWTTSAIESRLQAVERIPSEDHGRPAEFIPYRFEFANKLAKEHKLLLAFDAFLLSEVLGCEVNLGKIVDGDSYATLKVKVPAFASEIRKGIKAITALLAGNSPPNLVLNRHCGQCEFKTRCSTQAKERMNSVCYLAYRRKIARGSTARASSRSPSCPTHFVRVVIAGSREANKRNIIIPCGR